MKQNWVVLPMAEAEDPGIGSALRAANTHPVYYPCLRIDTLDDYRDFETALRGFCDQNAQDNKKQATNHANALWMLVASPAAVGALLDRLQHLGLEDSFPSDHLAVLGTLSQTALQAAGSIAGTDVHRIEHAGEGKNALIDAISRSAEIILPSAERAYEPLIPQLQRLGYTIHATPAYARFPATGGDEVGHLLFQGRIDAVLFSSPEQLRFFRRRLLNEGGVLSMLDHVQVYCLDGWTADVAAEYGLTHAQTLDTTDPDRIANSMIGT